MQRIAIHGRQIKDDSVKYVQVLLDELRKRNVDLVLSEAFIKSNRNQLNIKEIGSYPDKLAKDAVDAIFSLGGDGTLLDTITHVGDCRVPVLGVNTGRLGFLATTAQDAIPSALDLLLEGRYTLEERALICLKDENETFGSRSYALNEFAILRKETSSMITIKCFMNGEYLNTYWADGLMVSTPTGSTGYSLSCGGPIMMPDTHTFVITPVSPHNLNIRPLVIPNDRELTFQVDSRDARVLISLDSRSKPIAPGVDLSVKKAEFTIPLIKLEGNSFIETLRNKLGWGFDRRN